MYSNTPNAHTWHQRRESALKVKLDAVHCGIVRVVPVVKLDAVHCGIVKVEALQLQR